MQLHYGSRKIEDIIYRQELDRMDPGKTWLHQWHYLSSTGFRITADHVLERAGPDAPRAHWYMCGPDTLRQQLQTSLVQRGVPMHHLHSEAFATHAGQAVTTTPHSVPGGQRTTWLRVQQTGAMLTVQPKETLLTALERQGYHPDFSCRVGTCGTCKLQMLAGRVSPTGDALSNAERAQGFVLSCVAMPQTDVTLLSGGRPPARGGMVGVGYAGMANRFVPKSLVRLACVAMMGGVVFSAWNLTNHRPLSWQSGTAAPISTPGAGTATPGTGGFNGYPTVRPLPGSGDDNQPTPTPTPSSIFGGGGDQPTPTPTSGFGGGGGSQPTATPAPQPTDTPMPQPTAAPPPPMPTATTRPS